MLLLTALCIYSYFDSWIRYNFDNSSLPFWFQIDIAVTEHLIIYFDRVELHSLSSAPVIIDTGSTRPQTIAYGPLQGNIAVYGIV